MHQLANREKWNKKKLYCEQQKLHYIILLHSKSTNIYKIRNMNKILPFFYIIYTAWRVDNSFIPKLRPLSPPPHTYTIYLYFASLTSFLWHRYMFKYLQCNLFPSLLDKSWDILIPSHFKFIVWTDHYTFLQYFVKGAIELSHGHHQININFFFPIHLAVLRLWTSANCSLLAIQTTDPKARGTRSALL